MARSVPVWDLPTRLFHWLLVALFTFSWWCAENREMEWHFLSGVTLLGLLTFRLIWGFIGGSTARFGSFLRSPAKMVQSLRGKSPASHYPGHTPHGGYSVLAMLLLLSVQVGTGLFATDVDGLDSGPLSYLVSFDEGRAAAEIHETSFNLLLGLIGLHLLAILFYLVVRRRNLVWPMVTGSDADADDANGALVRAGPVKLVVAVAIAAALAWWTSQGLAT